MTPDDSDADLVEATRRGDGTAFEVLYRRHAPKIRVVVASTLRRSEGVDDAVQDVFVKAMEKLESLQDPSRFGPWLKSIARNVATDQLRARTTQDLDDVPEGDLVSTDVSVAELAEIRVLSGLVRGALTELSARDIRAIALAAFAGASPAEIAEDLGISEGAARVVLHRARKRLRVGLKLELLVRRQGVLPCSELADLVDAGETATAAQHIAGCETCQREGSIELRLYGAAGTGASLQVSVTVLLGPETRTVRLGRRLVVGRDDQDDPGTDAIILDDPQVSRRHLEIHLDQVRQAVLAIDASTNGTFLNDRALVRGEATMVRSGDRLRVGDAVLEVTVLVVPAPVDGSPVVVARGTLRGADTAAAVATLSSTARLHGASSATFMNGGFEVTWASDHHVPSVVAAAGVAFAVVAHDLVPDSSWAVAESAETAGALALASRGDGPRVQEAVAISVADEFVWTPAEPGARFGRHRRSEGRG